MSLKKYIAEAEVRQHIPQTGDVFAIELEDGTLLETYVMSMQDDIIVLDATPKMIGVLSEWADLDGEAGDVLLEGQFDMDMPTAESQHAMDEEQYQQEIDVADRGEYDLEGDMAKDDLATIIRAARKLTGMLDDNENMPEWVQSKINKAADYVDTAADYIESNKQRAGEQVNELSSDLLNRAAQAAKERRDQALDPSIHDALGGGYMNPLAKHYDKMSDKFDQRSSSVELKNKLRDLNISGVTQRKLPSVAKKMGTTEGEMDEDLSRRGFLRGLGAAALAGAAGSAMAGPNDPGFARRVQDKHLEMIEKNPRYANEHAALQLPLSRGIVGNAAETNKRWAIKTAELLQKYGVTVNEAEMDEAKYQGREVSLGKPTRGDVKKFKVYVRDPSTGNIKKVNFGHGGTSAKRLGQKTMKIKKSNPARRRSFRARHNCDNPGPRTSARYWSCRAW